MTKKAASILLSPLCFWPADCLHSLFSTYLLCLCLKHISDHLVRLPGEPVWATDRSQLTVIPPCTLPMLKIKCPKYKSLTLSTQMCDNIAPHVQLFFAQGSKIVYKIKWYCCTLAILACKCTQRKGLSINSTLGLNIFIRAAHSAF